MSTKSAAVEQQKSAVEIMSITEESKRRAEEAGKQWLKHTKQKVNAGLEIWNKLVRLASKNVQKLHSAENAQVFGIAIAALEEGKVRDRILMHACEGTLNCFGQEKTNDYIEETFLKLEQVVPDVHDIETMCVILRICCEYANDKQGYPFALLAYLLWWLGQFGAAYEYVGKALERDPKNSLANLLSRIFQLDVLPPWLARKCGSLHTSVVE